MTMKTMIWGGMFVGSAIGGFIPNFWGDSLFSFSSVVLTAVGGLVGIFAGFQLGKMLGL